MMKKILFFWAIFTISLINNVQAQISFPGFEDDKLIKTLDDVIYVVRQEYAVRGPDSLLYGDDNRDYFGVAYGPAVMIHHKLVMSKYTYYPYLRDTSFKRLGKNYVPEPTKTMIKHFKDSTYSIMDNDSIITSISSVLIPVQNSASINHNLSVEDHENMDCIVIAFTNSDSSFTEDSQFDYGYINNTVSWGKDGLGTLQQNDLGEDVKFGLLFYEYSDNGLAALIFGGFVEKADKNKWKAIKFAQPLTETKKEKIIGKS